jgi:hypothetical protein
VFNQPPRQAAQSERSNEQASPADPAENIEEAGPICCTGNCREGRDCPLRPRRARIAPVWLISALAVLLLVLMALTR